jgi:hypothetical protein
MGDHVRLYNNTVEGRRLACPGFDDAPTEVGLWNGGLPAQKDTKTQPEKCLPCTNRISENMSEYDRCDDYVRTNVSNFLRSLIDTAPWMC